MVNAELHLVALKDSFKQAANSLTQLYKQSSSSYNVAYTQGRLDAYEDVLSWLMADQSTYGAEQRHVSIQRFRTFVQERIQAQQRTSQGANFESGHSAGAPNSD